jgi:GTP-binding protein
LRSIERSLALVYVLDLGSEDPVQDWQILRGELEAYKEGLSDKAVCIVLNKGDGVEEVEGKEKVRRVKEEGRGLEVVVVSAKYGLGMKRVVDLLCERVARVRQKS